MGGTIASKVIREGHELAVGQRFVAFLTSHKQPTERLRLGDITRREPDVVFGAPEGVIGIEVACAYYDEQEAKEVWDIARGKITPEDTGVHGFVNPDAALAVELNRALQKHCAKTYAVPTYLVLDAFGVAHGPITTDRDAPTILAALTVPPDCCFRGIYLCLTAWANNEPVFLPVASEDGGRPER